jgi:hypothetical protein
MRLLAAAFIWLSIAALFAGLCYLFYGIGGWLAVLTLVWPALFFAAVFYVTGPDNT